MFSGALKIAVSNAFSCWPLVTFGSLPPWLFDASSVEYFFATWAHGVPDLIAASAVFAFGSPVVRTTRRSRVSGWAKRDLFFW